MVLEKLALAVPDLHKFSIFFSACQTIAERALFEAKPNIKHQSGRHGISSLFQSMILPPNANQAGPRHIDWSAATLDCTVGLQLQASNDECYGLQVPANPAPQWNGSVRVDFEFEAPSSPCSRGGPFSNSVLPNRNPC